MRGRWGIWIALLLGVPGAASQGSRPGQPGIAVEPTGTVTGRMILSDTQLPARFAEVFLVCKPEPADLDFYHRDEGAKTKAEKAPALARVVSISARCGLDGAYTARDVPAGDYYLIGKLAGYVVPFVWPASEKDALDLDKFMAAIPLVHVTANQVSTVDLTLRRGGVIAGRVLYDDGSPVEGMWVRAQAAKHTEPIPLLMYQPLSQVAMTDYRSGTQDPSGLTDDDGRFRIAGLPPGKYVVSTTIRTEAGSLMTHAVGSGSFSGSGSGNQQAVVTVYQPSEFVQSKAQIFEIKDDERAMGADIEVNLNGLHSVTGTVLVKEDRHVPNQAFAVLTPEGEAHMSDSHRRAQVDPDGSFHFDFVSPGTYTLVVGGEDVDMTPPPPELREWQPKLLHKFKHVEIDVIVGDQDVAVDQVLLVESKSKDEGDVGPP